MTNGAVQEARDALEAELRLIGARAAIEVEGHHGYARGHHGAGEGETASYSNKSARTTARFSWSCGRLHCGIRTRRCATLSQRLKSSPDDAHGHETAQVQGDQARPLGNTS